MRATPALLLSTALAASGLSAAEPAAAPVGAVQVRCPAAPAAYCEELVLALGARLPELAFAADPAPWGLTLTLTGQSPTRVSGHLALSAPQGGEQILPEAVVMLIDGAPATLAPRQLASVLTDLAAPALTAALALPR
jgi:hypothetical protein